MRETKTGAFCSAIIVMQEYMGNKFPDSESGFGGRLLEIFSKVDDFACQARKFDFVIVIIQVKPSFKTDMIICCSRLLSTRWKFLMMISRQSVTDFSLGMHFIIEAFYTFLFVKLIFIA